MDTYQPYFGILAAAFVRGKLTEDTIRSQYADLFTSPLESLAEQEQRALIQLGLDHELRLHRFKKTMQLPRVSKILGILKGLQPRELLDIGSGRGAFLWPLIDTFPFLPITCIDTLDYRVTDIHAVQAGGFSHLSAIQADATAIPFADRSFEVVTMLEVLEHIPDTRKALAEVCRVASKFLLLSVPSKEDNNPEHIHLFTAQHIKNLLREQHISRVTIDYVHNHMLVMARIEAL